MAWTVTRTRTAVRACSDKDVNSDENVNGDEDMDSDEDIESEEAPKRQAYH